MDIGLVCDQCDTFNPMTTQACAACGSALSLGGNKKSGAVLKPGSPLSSGSPVTPRPVSAVSSRAASAAAPAALAASVKAPTPAAMPAARAAVAPANSAASAAAPQRSPTPSAGPAPASGTRTCTECGSLVQVSFKFCGTCGARVDEPRAATPVAKSGAAAAAPAAVGLERRTMFFGQMQAARAKLVLIKGDGLD